MNLPRPGSDHRTRRVLAFVLAVVLPLLAADINAHIKLFEYAPFALYFFSIVLIAMLGGLAPSLIATALSIVCRSYLYYRHHGTFDFWVSDSLATIALTATSVVVSRFSGNRRRAYEQLQERTETLIESLHGAKCASWTLDLDSGSSPRWYSGSYPVFGRPFLEIEQAQSLVAFIHPEDRPRLPDLAQHMRNSAGPAIFEFRTPWPNGEVHWLEMRGIRVPGTVCVWRGITVDITDRKLAEFALLRSEKLAAMGRVASTVAHEINNPLEAVTNLLYLARTDPTLSDVTQSYLATAESELSRLAHITRLTLGFSRTSENPAQLDLAGVVESVLDIFRPRCDRKSIRVERNFQPGVAVVLLAHELRQVLTNLISNSIDALPASGGRIAVHVRCERGLAILAVEDNGMGIDAAHLARIFDPFFTTKEDIGTGIGLWVTRELVHKYGGDIVAESGDLPAGMKTRFRIELPLASQTASQPISPSAGN